MKTIKSLLYVLFAFAALAFVGCVKDETYSAGGDLSGDKVYISNAKSVFYVKTKAEKEEAAEENKKLSHGVTRTDLIAFEDDKQIELTIARTGKNLGVLDVDVELTMYNEESALFILPAGSVKTATGAQTVTYTVPVSFDEGAEKSALVIGFDISKLAENYEYEFNAALADADDGTQYGASSFDFVINHMVPVELPFTDIGEITLSQSVYGDLFTYTVPAYSGIKIQIHNEDLKVIEAAKAAGTEPQLDYVRFFIPKFMYQLATASLALGDGVCDEDDVEYFSDSDGLLLTMTPNYEPVFDYDHNTYGHPVFPDLYNKVFPLFGIAGITATGDITYWAFSGGSLIVSRIHIPAFNDGAELYYSFAVGLFNGYDSTVTRVNTTYTYDMAVLYDQGGGSIGGYINLPISFVWDTNKLEDDWANYFKVDYNNDIAYTSVGGGTFKSEYKSTEETKTLYKGYEAIAGTTVYYVDDVYGHSTEEASLGLALLWNGTTATVAPEQPTGETAFGKPLYISQSDNIKSAIELADNGSISKITFGVKLHFADGNVVGDYAETIEFAASDVSISKFIGTFTQTAYEIYSNVFDEEGAQQSPKLSPLSSTITIAQATDEDGNAIADKVIISGMISDDYLLGDSGTLEGTFDAETNCIIIPAQYFKKPVWNGAMVGLNYNVFPYFQPGETDYDYSDSGDQSQWYWYSTLGKKSGSCALFLDEDGSLYLSASPTDGSGNFTDGYAVTLYAYDASANEFVELGELFATFSNSGRVLPTFTPATGTSSVAKSSVRSIPAFSGQAKSVIAGHNGGSNKLIVRR